MGSVERVGVGVEEIGALHDHSRGERRADRERDDTECRGRPARATEHDEQHPELRDEQVDDDLVDTWQLLRARVEVGSDPAVQRDERKDGPRGDEHDDTGAVAPGGDARVHFGQGKEHGRDEHDDRQRQEHFAAVRDADVRIGQEHGDVRDGGCDVEVA